MILHEMVIKLIFATAMTDQLTELSTDQLVINSTSYQHSPELKTK